MRKILFGVLITLIVVFTFRYCDNRNSDQARIEEASTLIQKEIKNVGKLVVTEGTFAQVFTYNDSKNFYLDIFSAKKKALIVINAKVSIAYDLRKLVTEVDSENHIITITSIPEEEITINPDIEYYDVTQDYLNQFDADDYNKIKNKVNKSIQQKIEASELKANARNRLITELSNIYILTRSLGWKLIYKDQEINQMQEFENILTAT